MQFIDLAAQQKRIRADLEKRILAVLDHGRYVFGPEITELEEKFAKYCGVKHAVACGSGTDALLMSLMAYGVGPGDAVLTTPFTFMATAGTISLLGATPVFVDIDPVTYNLDPAALAKAIQACRTGTGYALPRGVDVFALTLKGIIGVDLFGLPADYEAINALAEENGLFVIEDAAQSFGATYKGRRACSLAEVATSSFFPAKPMGCYGDGGMIFSDDDGLADKLVSIRNHGAGTDKYDNIRIGLNGRMDSIQAAVLLAKFSLFEEEIQLRRQAADRYAELIGQAGLDLVSPTVPEDYSSVWAQYSILAGDEKLREGFQKKLSEAGIPTAIYYPKPLHLQTAFTGLGYEPGDLPVCEAIAGRVFSIPMHPYLTEEQMHLVINSLVGVK